MKNGKWCADWLFRDEADEVEIAKILRSTSRSNRLDQRPPSDELSDSEVLDRHNGAVEGESSEDEAEGTSKKKDKKLVFLSRSVLQKVKEKPMTTGTQVSSADSFR